MAGFDLSTWEGQWKDFNWDNHEELATGDFEKVVAAQLGEPVRLSHLSFFYVRAAHTSDRPSLPIHPMAFRRANTVHYSLALTWV